MTDYLEDDGGLDMHCPSCDMARRLRGVAAKGNQFVLAYGGLGWAGLFAAPVKRRRLGFEGGSEGRPPH